MNMSTITLQKAEYKDLKQKADAYEIILNITERDVLSSPPIRSSKKIISEFKKTGLYNKQFTDSLKHGLERSASFSR
jgi:hypothetical protein